MIISPWLERERIKEIIKFIQYKKTTKLSNMSNYKKIINFIFINFFIFVKNGTMLLCCRFFTNIINRLLYCLKEYSTIDPKVLLSVDNRLKLFYNTTDKCYNKFIWYWKTFTFTTYTLLFTLEICDACDDVKHMFPENRICDADIMWRCKAHVSRE